MTRHTVARTAARSGWSWVVALAVFGAAVVLAVQGEVRACVPCVNKQQDCPTCSSAAMLLELTGQRPSGDIASAARNGQTQVNVRASAPAAEPTNKYAVKLTFSEGGLPALMEWCFTKSIAGGVDGTDETNSTYTPKDPAVAKGQVLSSNNGATIVWISPSGAKVTCATGTNPTMTIKYPDGSTVLSTRNGATQTVTQGPVCVITTYADGTPGAAVVSQTRQVNGQAVYSGNWKTTVAAGSVGKRVRQTQTTYNTDGSKRFVTTITVHYPDNDANVNRRGKAWFTLEPDDVRKYLEADHLAQGINPNDPGAACGLDDTAAVTDAALESYASAKVANYDVDGRVLEVNYSAGCSSCGGGGAAAGTTTYGYGTAGGTGAVRYRRTTDPSGLKTVEFFDAADRIVYEVRQTGTGGSLKRWITHHVYDSVGNVLEKRHPDACTGYTLATTDEWVTGITPAATGTAGRSEIWVYDGNSNLLATKLRKGITGDVYWLSKTVYGSQGQTAIAVGGDVVSRIYRPTEQIEYPSDTTDENASDKRSTTFAYAYYCADGTVTTNQSAANVTHSVAFQKTTFPSVSTSHNGSGSALVRIEHYRQVLDTHNPVQPELNIYYADWTKNEDGTLDYRQEYRTNNLTKFSIRDVPTDGSGNVSGETEDDGSTGLQAPLDPWSSSRWTSPSGAGKKAKTAYTYDSYGRTQTVTGPDGLKSVTAYISQKVTASEKETTTRLITLSARHMDSNGKYDYVPVQVQVADPGGHVLLQAAGLPTSGTDGDLGNDWNTTTGAFTGTLTSRSESNYNTSGQLTSTVLWSKADDTDKDKYTTSYSYCDSTDLANGKIIGKLRDVTAPDGTITRTLYDALGRVKETQRGTTTGNLVTVSKTYYDGGTDNDPIVAGGDSQVTESRGYFGDGGSDYYASKSQYDWRGRLTQSRGPDKLATKITFTDSNGKQTTETYYDSDEDFTLDSGELRSKSESYIDESGRTYKTIQYEVDASGTVGHSMTSLSWVDAGGRTIKTKGPNGLFQKSAYDSLGRTTANYSCYQSAEGDTDYSAASTVTGDIVIEQSTILHDDSAGGVPWLVTSYQRKANATDNDTGALTTGTARVTYAVTWYDSLRRSTKTVAYGTNDGNVLDEQSDDFDPATAGTQNYAAGGPAVNTSANYRVSTIHFDSQGRVDESTDNAGKVTRTEWDWSGSHALVRTIESYVASNPQADQNRTTESVSDAAGRMQKLIAKDSQAGDQTTWYFYKSALSGAFLTDVVYPDAVGTDVENGDLKGGTTDHVHSVYDRLGRVISRTDQRGVVHEYVFNSAGQLSADKVTTCPGGVDGTVKRIEFGHDDRGRRTSWTSYDAASGGNVVNQTTHTYSDSAGTFNSLTKIQQNHTGSVDGNSPAIEYGIADGASSGAAAYLRRTSVTYPGKAGSRRVVYNNYPSSGIGAMVNRLDNLADDASGTTKYAQYGYFGAGSVYKVDHPAVSGGLTLNYDINSDHAYAAFSRLGQVIDHKWTSGDGSTVLDRHTYGYDKAGNRSYKRNEVAAAATQPFDELYGHDNLDRLKTADRGILNANRDALTGGTKSFAQAWTLDKLGNWTGFDHDADGNGWDIQQTRTHNAANEITGVTGGSWISPVHDAAGNMTQYPKAGAETTRLHAVYDAWNRMVEVRNDNGGSAGTLIVTYRYDGLNHKIRKIVEGGDTFDYYHNEGWQVLETRKNADSDPLEQWVWDQRYIDAPVVLFRDSDLDGTVNDMLYVTQDANFNVTALVNASSGAVVERYAYSPYGLRAVLDGNYGSRASSSYDFPLGHQGGRWDAEVGLYDFRYRPSHPTVGRWMQRDPIGYADGMSSYQFVASDPTRKIDPMGLTAATQSSVTQPPLPSGLNQMTYEAINTIRDAVKREGEQYNRYRDQLERDHAATQDFSLWDQIRWKFAEPSDLMRVPNCDTWANPVIGPLADAIGSQALLFSKRPPSAPILELFQYPIPVLQQALASAIAKKAKRAEIDAYMLSNCMLRCKQGYYKSMFMVGPNDYHFAHQHPDGKWSEKWGRFWTPGMVKDCTKDAIDHYTSQGKTIVGCYCVQGAGRVKPLEALYKNPE